MPSDHFAADWPAPASVRTLITTRNGGVSAPPYDTFNLGDHVGDDPAAVAANRARLARMLPAPPRWLRQVHGVRVVDADDESLWHASPSNAPGLRDAKASVGLPNEAHKAGVQAIPEADAAVARAPGTVCAILVADCLPVLLCSRDAPVVAAAHAGWRGLSGGVLEATVSAMDVEPGGVVAYLGPAIGPTAFEVGADVLAAFDAQRDADARRCFVPAAGGTDGAPKWRADLYALARLRLQRIGVVSAYGGSDCTVGQPARFFSHRRDRVSGRQAALIWME